MVDLARPPLAADQAGVPVAAPSQRLSRHTLQLDRHSRVQLAVAGRGVPLVLVHGYSAEGFLYAQTLSRLVGQDFKVIAVDTAGHGGTAGLAEGGGDMQSYAGLLGRVIDHLGIRQAVFAGHSMGGRIVTELVAREPSRALAVVLMDAIVGDTWDGMVQMWRLAPPLMGMTGAGLFLDTASTIPFLRDPRQALKLTRLWAPVWFHNLRRPTGLIGPAISILRSGPTRWMLERLAEAKVPTVVIHGDRDLAVPMRTARDAARRSGGQLVVVHGASHSWPLKDPATLPAIMAELLDGKLRRQLWAAAGKKGSPAEPSIDDLERAFYDPGALILGLGPMGTSEVAPSTPRRAGPRYRWTVEPTPAP